MAEIRSLTFSLTWQANAVSALLKVGAPWENGAVLAGPEAPRVLWAGTDLTDDKVRGQVLGEKPSQAVLRKAGAHLGELLLGGTIEAAWTAQGDGVRCYLETDPKLEWIPWETAIVPSTQQPVFINPSTP